MTNGLEKGSKEIIEAKENEIQKLSERVKALESEVEMLKKDKAALEKKRDELEKNIKERPAAVNNKVDTTDATTSHAASKRKYLHKFCKKKILKGLKVVKSQKDFQIMGQSHDLHNLGLKNT